MPQALAESSAREEFIRYAGLNGLYVLVLTIVSSMGASPAVLLALWPVWLFLHGVLGYLIGRWPLIWRGALAVPAVHMAAQLFFFLVFFRQLFVFMSLGENSLEALMTFAFLRGLLLEGAVVYALALAAGACGLLVRFVASNGISAIVPQTVPDRSSTASGARSTIQHQEAAVSQSAAGAPTSSSPQPSAVSVSSQTPVARVAPERPTIPTEKLEGDELIARLTSGDDPA